MKIILKREIDELLKNDWRSLENISDPLIYQSLVWNLSWLNENKKSQNALIFIVYDDNKPVIIFPFCVIKKLNFKILRWIGYDISDYLGPLVDIEYKIEKKDFKSIWNKILALIKKECDLIFLDKQINENFFSNNLIVKNLDCDKYDKIYRTDLFKWNEIKKNKNRTLQKFRWSKKKLSEVGNLKFIEKVDNYHEKKNLINKAILWKKEKMKKSKFVVSFSEKFYCNLIDDKNIIISGLKLDDDFIAISLGFSKNQNYFYLVPSYKVTSNLEKYSPGKILMIELIDFFANKNFKYFDFCDGKETYKEYWTNNMIELMEYIKPTNLSGLLLRFLLKIKKKYEK